jgi:hypothetical protein
MQVSRELVQPTFGMRMIGQLWRVPAQSLSTTVYVSIHVIISTKLHFLIYIYIYIYIFVKNVFVLLSPLIFEYNTHTYMYIYTYIHDDEAL